jgi:Ca2+-transporting ATPase
VGPVRACSLDGFFATTTLTTIQWLAAAAIGSTVLWLEELHKAVVRHRQRAGAER